MTQTQLFNLYIYMCVCMYNLTIQIIIYVIKKSVIKILFEFELVNVF